MKIPRRLEKGSKVAIVSISSAAGHSFPGVYSWGKTQIQNELGLEVIEMPNALVSPDDQSRNLDLRLSDLYKALEDPKIDGIIATIGGDDTIRLLKRIDLKKIQDNPKPFCGMSDNTVIHFMFHKAGVRSYYSPTVMFGIADAGGINPYTKDSFQRTLMQTDPIGFLEPYRGLKPAEYLPWNNPEMMKYPVKSLPATEWDWVASNTKAQGRLFGGCVEVISPSIMGTSLWPNNSMFWDDKVLFLEWSRELADPNFARWFFQNLAAQGILDRIQGLIIGRHHFTVGAEDAAKIKSAILGVIHGEEGKFDLPICLDVDFGHTLPMLTLPYGALLEINTKERTLCILESGVS